MINKFKNIMKEYPFITSEKRHNGSWVIKIEFSIDNFVRIQVDSEEQALLLTCVDRIPAVMPKASNQILIKTIE